MIKKLWESKHLFPPGYEYRGERNAAVLLLITGMAYSLRFFGRLYRALGELYVYADGTWKLRREIPEEGRRFFFGQLTEGNWKFCLPFFLFLSVMTIFHYAYYYRGTRSIYLMRRLPGRWEILKSCACGPALGIAFGAVCMAVLQLLYYVIYLFVIPAPYRP